MILVIYKNVKKEIEKVQIAPEKYTLKELNVLMDGYNESSPKYLAELKEVNGDEVGLFEFLIGEGKYKQLHNINEIIGLLDDFIERVDNLSLDVNGVRRKLELLEEND
ncbi:MAG: hypothetical protein MJZ30_09945 [Paludibacteraceae bacterium]|nr:hypothetical protein [Paludibacteraceae bacterium]